MELSKEVIEKLVKLSNVTEKGAWFTKNTLGLASNNGGIVAYYDYGVDFDVPDLTDDDLTDEEKKQEGFGIYDLPNFLSILQLYENPKVTLHEHHLMIQDSNGKNKNKYRYCDKSSIKPPKFSKNDVFSKVIGNAKSTISITKDEMIKINKQSGILGAEHLVFDEKTLTVTDINNSSFNDFTNTLSPDNDIEKITISSSNFSKIIPDDYTITFHGQAVVLKNKSGDINYILVGLSV